MWHLAGLTTTAFRPPGFRRPATFQPMEPRLRPVRLRHLYRGAAGVSMNWMKWFDEAEPADGLTRFMVEYTRSLKENRRMLDERARTIEEMSRTIRNTTRILEEYGKSVEGRSADDPSPRSERG